MVESCRDVKLIFLQRFIRLFAYGASFLILVQFLSSKGFSDGRIGIFMTLTLFGDAIISLLLTLITDQVGRRRVLAAGASLMVGSGLTFYKSDNYWILLLASVFGVISPSGNEIGPFRAVEESILAHLTPKEKRSDVLAWYTLFGTAGVALGTLTCGWMVQLIQNLDYGTTGAAHQVVFLIYAALGVAKLLSVATMTSAVEVGQPESRSRGVATEQSRLLSSDGECEDGLSSQDESKPSTNMLPGCVLTLLPKVSPTSISIVCRLVLLFTLDSFASGMASPSWLTYFFTTIHSLKPSALGTLFLTTNLLATASNFVALPLARRFGPLKTMVFTHLPSAIFLSMVPVPNTTESGTHIAMLFLALRACTQSMDQAPRQAFLAAAVLPSERTAVLGVVNIAKTLAQAGGLGFAGILAGRHLWVALLGGAGGLKALYDILMLWMFLRLQDREDDPEAAT